MTKGAHLEWQYMLNFPWWTDLLLVSILYQEDLKASQTKQALRTLPSNLYMVNIPGICLYLEEWAMYVSCPNQELLVLSVTCSFWIIDVELYCRYCSSPSGFCTQQNYTTHLRRESSAPSELVAYRWTLDALLPQGGSMPQSWLFALPLNHAVACPWRHLQSREHAEAASAFICSERLVFIEMNSGKRIKRLIVWNVSVNPPSAFFVFKICLKK